jgi:hypothetical protein
LILSAALGWTSTSTGKTFVTIFFFSYRHFVDEKAKKKALSGGCLLVFDHQEQA